MPLEPILYALAVAAAVLALGWRPWQGEAAPRTGPPASALLFPLCFAGGWYGYRGEPVPFPPTEAFTWAFSASLMGLLLVPLPPPDRGRRALGVLGAGMIAGGLLAWGATGALLRREHGEGWGLALVGAIALLVGGVHLGLAALEPRRGSGAGPAWLLLLTLATGAAVQRGTFGGGGLLLGALCAGAGGLWVLGLWRGDWRVVHCASAPAHLALAGVLLTGATYAETSRLASAAVLCMPLAGWVGGRGVPGAVARSALAAALGAVALGLSWPEPDPYGAY